MDITDQTPHIRINRAPAIHYGFRYPNGDIAEHTICNSGGVYAGEANFTPVTAPVTCKRCLKMAASK